MNKLVFIFITIVSVLFISCNSHSEEKTGYNDTTRIENDSDMDDHKGMQTDETLVDEDHADYSDLDSMFSNMTRFENLLKLRCETKDISCEYYKEKTGKEISDLGDVGYYSKVINRYSNSKNICLIKLVTIDEQFFDHQYVQEIYVFYKDGLLALISVDNKMSDDFQTTQDSNTFNCDEQKFYFIPNGKCIRALEKKYEYIDSPELPLQYIDSLSKHTAYIESNCAMGDSVRNELTKLLEKY